MAGGSQKEKQDAAIIALLSCGEVQAAARMVNVGESTLWRWLREDADFQQRYRQAKQDAIDAAVNRLVASAGSAVDVLLSIAKNADLAPSARVSACRCVLDHTLRTVENEGIAAKLEELEAALMVKRRA